MQRRFMKRLYGNPKCESDVDATVFLVRVWEFALFGQFGDYLVSEKLSVNPKSVLTVG